MSELEIKILKAAIHICLEIRPEMFNELSGKTIRIPFSVDGVINEMVYSVTMGRLVSIEYKVTRGETISLINGTGYSTDRDIKTIIL
jgi:hypothetical protein